MNKRLLYLKDVSKAFSIFLKSRKNMIPKYEHIITPYVLSTSIFTRVVQTVSCLFRTQFW